GEDQGTEITGPEATGVLPFSGLLVEVTTRGDADAANYPRPGLSLDFVEPDGHPDAPLEGADLEFGRLRRPVRLLGLDRGHGVLLFLVMGKTALRRSLPNGKQRMLP